MYPGGGDCGVFRAYGDHTADSEATYLLFVLFATAGIYFELNYAFLGAVQLTVYAGGIIVLYVFSILLTSPDGDKLATKLPKSKFFAGLVAAVAGAVLCIFITLFIRFYCAIWLKHTFMAITFT